MDSMFHGLNLFYQVNEENLPIPKWAQFYLELGEALADIDIFSRRFVVAVAVPARAYVAPFIAAGIVLKRASIDDESRDDEHYINRLRNLQPGSSVRYISGSNRRRGWFQGFEWIGDSEFIVITFEEGSKSYQPLSNARAIQISERDFSRLPKKQGGRAIVSRSELTEAILKPEMAREFYQQSQLDCLFVALKREFEAIVAGTKLFTLGNSGQVEHGSLAQLLRIRDMLGSGSAYRTNLVSPSPSKGDDAMKRLSQETRPYVVIFDRNRGFIKWQSYWSTTNQIVVLDKTEGSFLPALQILGREVLHRRHVSSLEVSLPEAPRSIDLMAFEVAIDG